MYASHVVVDTHDGYTFAKGADGELFDAETAAAFADQRNAEMKPEHQLYEVFALVDTAVHVAGLALARAVADASPAPGEPA